MIKNPLKKETFTALKNSYLESQVLHLSFDRNVNKIIEYFITINLCKEYLKWNEKNHYKYKIEAEKLTSQVFNDCFENYKYIGKTFTCHQYLQVKQKNLKKT